MNLIAIAQQLAMRGRQPSAHISRRAQSLRLAGYFDGERMPRKPAHWANR